MASKRKAPPTPHPRNVVQVFVHDANDTRDAATARELTRPSVQAAATIQKWQIDNYEVNALAAELAGQVAAVNAGDMSRAEAMLISQAHTLDELFNSLARRSHVNILGGYLSAAETYLRLSLKAQSQCRATLETLANIKNPPVIYARQANIANGPQQVNNAIPDPSCARVVKNEPIKLLENDDREPLETQTEGSICRSQGITATSLKG